MAEARSDPSASFYQVQLHGSLRGMGGAGFNSKLDTRCPACGQQLRSNGQDAFPGSVCPRCHHQLAKPTPPELPQETIAVHETREIASGQSDRKGVNAATGIVNAGGRFGRFENLRPLGQGAFGAVFRARDPQLDRDVALKIPLFSAYDSRKRARFLREARAAARLRHQNLVAVYESGEIDNQLYIASAFIDGEILSARIRRDRPDPRTAATWIAQLASALAYAHQHNIVHRDVKPENIIIDHAGHPQLMDFGLAKRTDEDSTATTDGTILGTPAYMAPEQARGEHDRVGPLSDQYSLGAVLYELLTGRRPFEGPPLLVVSQVAADQEPVPLGSLVPALPRDIVAICQKAMRTEPALRYGAISELGDDLEDYLHGRPIRARPIGTWERFGKWLRRNPILGGMAVLVVTVTFIGLVATTIAWQKAQEASREAMEYLAASRQSQADLRQEEQQTQLLKVEARQMQAEAIQRKKEAEEKSRLAALQADELKNRTKQLESATTLATQESAAREMAVSNERKALQEKQKEILKGQLQAELERASALCVQGRGAEGLHYMVEALNRIPAETDSDQFRELRDAFRKEFDVHRGRLAVLRGMFPLTHFDPDAVSSLRPNGVQSVLPSQMSSTRTADGRRMVVVNNGLNFQTRLPEASFSIQTINKSQGLYSGLIPGIEIRVSTISPDGSRISLIGRTSTGDWIIQAWSVRLNRLEKLWEVYPEIRGNYSDTCLAYTTDNQVLHASIGATVQSFDAVLGKAGGSPETFDHPVSRLAVSPSPGDGRLLVVTGKTAWLLSRSTTIERIGFSHDRPIESTCFSKSGDWLVTGGADDLARLWNSRTGEPAGTPMMHDRPVTQVGFTDDEGHVVTGCGHGNQEIRLWNVESLTGGNSTETAVPIFAKRAAFSPDGQMLIAEDSPLLTVYRVATQPASAVHEVRIPGIQKFAFLGSGDRFATVDGRNLVQIYLTWDDRRLDQFPVGNRLDEILELAGPKRSGIVWLATRSRIVECDISKRKFRDLRKLESPPAAMTASSEGNRLACATQDGELVQLTFDDDRSTPSILVRPVLPAASCLQYDRTGSRLLVGRNDGSVLLWDADKLEPISRPLLHRTRTPIRHLAFQGADRLISINGDEARVWDVNTGASLSQEPIPEVTDRAVALSPDGMRIFVNQIVRPFGRAVKLKSDNESLWLKVATGTDIDASGSIHFLTQKQWQSLKNELDGLP